MSKRKGTANLQSDLQSEGATFTGDQEDELGVRLSRSSAAKSTARQPVVPHDDERESAGEQVRKARKGKTAADEEQPLLDADDREAEVSSPKKKKETSADKGSDRGFFGTIGHTAFAKPWRKAADTFLDNGIQYRTGVEDTKAAQDDKAPKKKKDEYRSTYWPDNWNKLDFKNDTVGQTAGKIFAGLAEFPGKAVNAVCNGVGFLANGACKMAGGLIKTIGKGVGWVADKLEQHGGVIGKAVASVTLRPLETGLNAAGNAVNAVGDVVQDACKLVGAAANAAMPTTWVSGRAGDAFRNLKDSFAQAVTSPVIAAGNILSDTAQDMVKQGERMYENGSTFPGRWAQGIGHTLEAIDKSVGPSTVGAVLRQGLEGNFLDMARTGREAWNMAGYEATKVARSIAGSTQDGETTRYKDPRTNGRDGRLTMGERFELRKQGRGNEEIQAMNNPETVDKIKAVAKALDGNITAGMREVRAVSGTDAAYSHGPQKAPKSLQR